MHCHGVTADTRIKFERGTDRPGDQLDVTMYAVPPALAGLGADAVVAPDPEPGAAGCPGLRARKSSSSLFARCVTDMECLDAALGVFAATMLRFAMLYANTPSVANTMPAVLVGDMGTRKYAIPAQMMARRFRQLRMVNVKCGTSDSNMYDDTDVTNWDAVDSATMGTSAL